MRNGYFILINDSNLSPNEKGTMLIVEYFISYACINHLYFSL